MQPPPPEVVERISGSSAFTPSPRWCERLAVPQCHVTPLWVSCVGEELTSSQETLGLTCLCPKPKLTEPQSTSLPFRVWDSAGLRETSSCPRSHSHRDRTRSQPSSHLDRFLCL